MKTTGALLALLLLLAGCEITGDSRDELPEPNYTTLHMLGPGEYPDPLPAMIPVTVDSAWIDQEDLLLKVEYGGCDTNPGFELWGRNTCPNCRSWPPEIDALVVLRTDGGAICDRLNRSTLRFSLSPLKGNAASLWIHGPNSTTGKRVEYNVPAR